MKDVGNAKPNGQAIQTRTDAVVNDVLTNMAL